ncbi:MAG: thiolase family protein [Nitrosopumilus sp.]|nr:thiolase family protein [Nitrosopumilus sp.]
MPKVAIVGYGQTKFSKEDLKIESILLKATKNLFDSTSNLTQKDIDAVLVSTNNNSKYLSAILSEMIGIQPKISHSIESLCNSGTNSIVSAYSYIKSGLAEVVLISGAERYDSPGQILEWDNLRGEYKHPVFWASIFSKSYKKKYDVTDEDLAFVPVKNHKHSKNNPYAFSQKNISIEDVLNSKKLTDDLRLLDCSRPCTGGSSVLLASEKYCKQFTDCPIWITGIGQKTTFASFTKNQTFHNMESTKQAAKSAFNMAKRCQNDIDVMEIHDAFSVCEPMALDSIGFSNQGEGIKMIKESYSSESSKINPRGGLIGSGHPLGATGISQTIEITQQLQSKANKRQVDKANIGLIHNMAAAATSSTVLVLEN